MLDWEHVYGMLLALVEAVSSSHHDIPSLTVDPSEDSWRDQSLRL